MTRDEVFKWCEERAAMPRQTVYNTENGHKERYSNGDTYDFKYIKYDIREKVSQIFINGAMVLEQVTA